MSFGAGLTEEELEFLAQCGSAAAKTSRRDIAQVVGITVVQPSLSAYDVLVSVVIVGRIGSC